MYAVKGGCVGPAIRLVKYIEKTKPDNSVMTQLLIKKKRQPTSKTRLIHVHSVCRMSCGRWVSRYHCKTKFTFDFICLLQYC